MSQARVSKGVPTGGRYAAAEHAEAPVALEQPASHGEEAIFAARMDASLRIIALREELDNVNLQGAVEGVRRLYPTAVELRAKRSRSDHRIQLLPSSLRDADGANPAADDPLWLHRATNDHSLSIGLHVTEYEGHALHTDPRIGYDPETEDYVFRVDATYWKGSEA